MALTVRVSTQDEKLIREYAKLKGVTVSELMRRSIIERIEDELDLEAYNLAMEEYRNNPVTYTQAEVERMLGIE